MITPASKRTSLVVIALALSLASLRVSAATPPVLWQANAGFGSGGAAVTDGRVYTVGLFNPGTTSANLSQKNSTPTMAEVAKGEFPGIDLPGTPPEAKSLKFPASFRGDLYALCLDARTGRQIWASKLSDYGLAFTARPHAGTAWEVAAPLLEKGKLYIHTHTGQVYCLDASAGAVKWTANLYDHGMSAWNDGQQGNSSSPLAFGGNIIVGFEGGKSEDPNTKGAGCFMVAGLDAETGSRRWVARAPMGALNARTARLGFATLSGKPTVLCSCGGGTMGVDPMTGAIQWSFNLFDANPDTMQRVPARYTTPEATAKAYKGDAMRAPYPGYAPLAWGDYVVDASCVGHNSVTSAIWGLKISDGKATRVWQTSDFVPGSASVKSNMIVRDGKIYGFDSHFPRFETQYPTTRPYRGESLGQFQCRDVATGKLLWSSDAFHPEPAHHDRVDSTNCLFTIIGDDVFVGNHHGFFIGRIRGNSVTVLARIPMLPRAGRTLSEPTVVNGRLFIRQVDNDPATGILATLGPGGNLTCLDVSALK